MNERKERPVSDYQLERYLLREGSASELADLDRRVAADPVLAQRVAALERSNEELHRRYPPAWMGRRIEAKLEERRGRVRRRRREYRFWAVPAVVLTLAAVGVITLFDQARRDRSLPAGGEESPLRLKGGEEGPRLAIYRKLANGSERLKDGAPAKSGDLVQIAYRSGGLRYGAILSVDGRGAVTLHLPASGEKAVPLTARDTLDFAYELDDAPRWERFYLVAGDRRFDLKPVRKKLTAGDRTLKRQEGALAGGLRFHRFTLKKPGSS